MPDRSRRARDAQTSLGVVLDAAPDAVLLFDRHGVIVLNNSQAELLFGYGHDELLGQGIQAIVPEHERPESEIRRRRYFDDPQPRFTGDGTDFIGLRKDGSEFPMEATTSPIEIEGDTYAMVAIRDVSRRRQADEEIQRANRELEAFTYSVSHDLRAPIRQINGFARILDEYVGESLDAKARHYLQRIQDGAEHMGRLLDDLLNLARLGQQDVNLRRVRLDSVLDDALADMEPGPATTRHQLRRSPLPVVECDAGLMTVVFANLLSNAAKYSRPREEAVIEVGTTSMNGVDVVFVRDNGVGFDMRYADKLFGVFQRLHRAEEFEGTGVGLATVQRIVRKHGGEIWVDAALDRGATFYFTLGQARPRMDAEAAPRVDAPPELSRS